MRSTTLLSSLLCTSILLSACGDRQDIDDYGEIESYGESGDDMGDDEGEGDAGDDGKLHGHSFEPETGECAEVRLSTDPVVPTVLMLVDQSGSMHEGFGDQSRWDAVYDTLMNADSGIVKQLEDRVSIGLSLYTSEQGFENGKDCPLLTEVEPGLDNHTAMDQVFSGAQPVDDTPTGDALMAVAANLDALDVDGPKAIVVATDGYPDTCEQPDPQQGESEAIAAAQAAHDMGIRTYIISVGDDVGDAHLQQMANAGAGLEPEGIETVPFYKALGSEELVDAFDEIAETVENCIIPLDGMVPIENACDGVVTLDDQPLECGSEFKLLDESTLELLGGACDILRDGQAHDVTGSWECGIAVP
jgi:hypothetical protein